MKKTLTAIASSAEIHCLLAMTEGKNVVIASDRRERLSTQPVIKSSHCEAVPSTAVAIAFMFLVLFVLCLVFVFWG